MRSSSILRISAVFALGALLATGSVELGASAGASAAETLPTISLTDATGASTGSLADLGTAGEGKLTLATDLVCPAGATNYDYVIEERVITESEEFLDVENLAHVTGMRPTPIGR